MPLWLWLLIIFLSTFIVGAYIHLHGVTGTGC